MGEEEKKKQGGQGQAKKAKPEEEKKAEEPKEAPAPAPAATPPPPPPPIVLKIYMHCEGCARKVKKSLKGFEGIEDIQTDCKAHKVTVKGKDLDPMKVLETLQNKSHRKVELVSPIPKPAPSPPAAQDKEKKSEAQVKSEEKKEESKVVTVVLKVHMHCEACAQEIRKRIMKMKGVEAANPDLSSSHVTVKGVFDPPKLVEFVYKRTGKHAVIVKTEAEKKKEEEKAKEEKKDEKKEEKQEKNDGDAKPVEEGTKVEVMKNEFYYYPPKPAMEYYSYSPQIFSDENPNACSVM